MKGVEEVAEGVGDDDVVVAADYGGNSNHGVSDALEDRDAVEGLDRSLGAKLAERNFKEENGQAANDQADQVGDQECSATVLIRQIGKSPDVPQTDSVAHHREHELDLVAQLWRPGRDLIIMSFI